MPPFNAKNPLNLSPKFGSESVHFSLKHGKVLIMDNATSVLTDKTKLRDLIADGVETLADLPLEDLMVYVRHNLLAVSRDLQKSSDKKEAEWGVEFGKAAEGLQVALDALNHGQHEEPDSAVLLARFFPEEIL